MTKSAPITKEFEREAVRLAETSGRTRHEIADDLGIGLSRLTRGLSRTSDATWMMRKLSVWAAALTDPHTVHVTREPESRSYRGWSS